MYLKNTAKMIINDYGGKVPLSSSEIIKFQGIGEVSALMLEQYVFNNVTGIAVDSHILRVSQKLGWTDSLVAKGARKDLESWVPREKWGSLYGNFLGYGQGV